MLKAENKKILQICLAATATLTLLIGIVPVGVIVVYASNDQNNNNDRNDDSPQNKACYNVGFADWKKIIHTVKPCSTSVVLIVGNARI